MNLTTNYARTMVEVLVNSGVEHFVVSPGSRNAPLLYALAAANQTQNIFLHVRIDERNAAFTALGIAKASKKPVAVITTSGTAVANLHPAVLEAHHSHVPLLFITADRPKHMQGIGANQTTQQNKIFGDSCRLNLDLPTFTGAQVELKSLVANTKRAVAAAQGNRTGDLGPVHINVAFSEPLTPDVDYNYPFTQTTVSNIEVPQFCFTAKGVADFAKTVVIAGDGANCNVQSYVQKNNIPLLAEPSSNVRYGTNVVNFYRLVLEHFCEQVQRVIVCGKPTLSREINSLLLQNDLEIWVVDPYGQNWVDFSNNATRVVLDVEQLPVAPPQTKKWLQLWLDKSDNISQICEEKIRFSEPLTGLHVVKQVWETVSEQALFGQQNLVVGASNVIRDLDLVAPNITVQQAENVQVFSNRGLAGIDGTVSTAMGVAIAAGCYGSKSMTRLLVGDLTFLHDVGGLFVGQGEVLPDLQIILVNDNGGSIFGRLEHGKLGRQVGYQEIVERFFTTPHCVDFAKIVQAYGVGYMKVENMLQLKRCLQNPKPFMSVVEVVVDMGDAQEVYDYVLQIPKA